MGGKITSLVITQSIERNRCNFSTLIDIVAFSTLIVMKLGVTLGLSTAKCENSFFVLKTIMQDLRQRAMV